MGRACIQGGAMVRLPIVKAFARLVLIIVASFALLLGAGTALAISRAWVTASLPYGGAAFAPWEMALDGAWSSLPIAFYACSLAASVFASRHSMPVLRSGTVVFIVSAALLAGGTAGLAFLSASSVEEAADPGHTAAPARAGTAGLIASRRNGGDVVFIASEAADGARAVLAVPGSPLAVVDAASEAARGGFESPYAAATDARGMGAALGRALSGARSRLAAAADRGILPLAAYASALAFLLASFRRLVGYRRWPLAGLVFGVGSTALVVALEALIAEPAAGRLMGALAAYLQADYIPAAALAAAGLVVALASALAGAAFGREPPHA